MIRILIAHDLGIGRSGLKQLFSLMDGITVTGEATNCGEILDALLGGCTPDLLLLKMDMPDTSGFELISCVRAQNKSLPILIYSIHTEPAIAAHAFQLGASGFITMFCSQDTLVEAIRKVAAGGRFVDPELVGQVIFERTPEKEAPHHQLSEHELLILKLFAQGKTSNEIAQKLSISNQAVSTHKTNLMQKMNFNGIAELVLYAVEYALID